MASKPKHNCVSHVPALAVAILITAGLCVRGGLESEDGVFVVSSKSDNSLSEFEAPPPKPDELPAAGIENSSAVEVEIDSFKIHSDIRYRYCRTEVISKVTNRNANSSNDVAFQMVLPEAALISKFSLEIDGKTYETHVKEKDEAKEIYSDARNTGQNAGIVEVDVIRSNVFEVNVTVDPKSQVTFNLTYEELLPRKWERYEHVVRINPKKLANVPDFEVTVSIHESGNITWIHATTAPRNSTENGNSKAEGSNYEPNITVSNGNSALISWSPTPTVETRRIHNWESADKNDTKKFVVKYDVERKSDAGEILLSKSGYFVHFFAPESIRPLRRHVVFVLDTSSSMKGDRITQLKKAMRHMLEDLKPDDYFSVIYFGSNVDVWTPFETPNKVTESRRRPDLDPQHQRTNILGISPIPPRPHETYRVPISATQENLQEAQEFIDSLVAKEGSNLDSALMEALMIISKSKSLLAAQDNPEEATEVQFIECMIILLTDGQPTVGGVTSKKAILERIHSFNIESHAPIYSINFGHGTYFRFLKEISLLTKGHARKICEAGDVDVQIREFYKEISSPILSNIKFQYSSDNYTISKLTNQRFHHFQRGSEIAVAGYLMPKVGSVTSESVNEQSLEPFNLDINVEVTHRNGTINFKEASITILKNSEDNFIERLWAYITMKQLLETEPGSNDPEEHANDFKDSKVDSVDVDARLQGLENIYNILNSDPEQPKNLKVLHPNMQRETWKQHALRIALKYGFVTPITSLVVVKPNGKTSLVELESDFLALNTRHSSVMPYNYWNRVSTTASTISPDENRANIASRHPNYRHRTPNPTSRSGNRVTVPVTVGWPYMDRNTSDSASMASTRRRKYYPGLPPQYPLLHSVPRSSVYKHSSRSSNPRPGLLNPEPFVAFPGLTLSETARIWNVGTVRPPFKAEASSDITWNNYGKLQRIKWLSPMGYPEDAIRVNGTQYAIAKGPWVQIHPLGKPYCVIKASRAKSEQETGTCRPLIQCVVSEFENDRSIYEKDYFCPILRGELNYAGACCAETT